MYFYSFRMNYLTVNRKRSSFVPDLPKQQHREVRMFSMGWKPRTEVSVSDYANLREFWKCYKRSQAWDFIGTVLVKKPLTDSQLSRLHPDLRRKVRNPDDSGDFLERLWSLADPREA